jgi:hypothetical protein
LFARHVLVIEAWQDVAVAMNTGEGVEPSKTLDSRRFVDSSRDSRLLIAQGLGYMTKHEARRVLRKERRLGSIEVREARCDWLNVHTTWDLGILRLTSGTFRQVEEVTDINDKYHQNALPLRASVRGFDLGDRP